MTKTNLTLRNAELNSVQTRRANSSSASRNTRTERRPSKPLIGVYAKSILFKLDSTLLMLPAMAFGFGAMIFSRVECTKKPFPQLIGCLFRKSLGFATDLFSLPAKVYTFAKSMFFQMLNVITFNKFRPLKIISRNSVRQLMKLDVGCGMAAVIMGRAFCFTYKDAFKEYGYCLKVLVLHVSL